MQEGGGHFAAHALAEGELAHGRLQQVFDLEGLSQEVDAAAQGCVFQFVDLTEEVEGIYRGQVIPELGALPEDGADLEGERLPLPPGNMAEHGGFAGGGVEDAGEDLDRGRFTGAVGADEAEQFAFFHGEGQVAHGLKRLKSGPPQRGQRAAKARGLALGLECLAQIAHRDGGHGCVLISDLGGPTRRFALWRDRETLQIGRRGAIIIGVGGIAKKVGLNSEARAVRFSLKWL